jgi:hypothetical protein
VNLSNEAQRKGKASLDATETMLHRSHIVGDLFNIINGHTGHRFILKEKQI